MVGRRIAAVTGLAALLLTGASLLGPVGAGATTRPAAPDTDVFTRVRDCYDRIRDRMRDHLLDHHGGSDAPGSDSADDGSGTFGGTPAPVTGQPAGEPSVGGAQATTNGADGNETLVASTAPTPPNGAEPPAAASPGVADTSPVAVEVPADATAVSTPAETAVSAPAETAPALDERLLDGLDGVIGTTGPKPVAAGLSADTTRPGVLVAVLAFAVLLFLVGYQLIDRRDPRRDSTRDDEAVARFR